MAEFVTLALGGTSVQVKSYSYGWKKEKQYFQTEVYTEGGTFIGQELADPQETRVFTFNNLTDAEVADLESFHTDDINGKENSFTFTDTDSVQYTVRWVDDLFDPVHQSYNSWTLIMRLLIIS